MAFEIKAEVTGLKELVKRLEALPVKIQKKTLRKAVTEGARLILRTAKTKVAVGETGLLKKSLGQKVGISRRAGSVYAVIGPRTGYKKTKKGRTRTKLGDKLVAAGVKPHFYAHFVEKGTRHSGAKPFMRPALDENIGAVKQIFVKHIQEALKEHSSA